MAGIDEYEATNLFTLLQKYLQVQYVSAEESSATDSLPIAIGKASLTPAAFNSVPEDLLLTLEQATDQSSKKERATAIEHIRPYAASVAYALDRLADDIHYDDILVAIRTWKEEHYDT